MVHAPRNFDKPAPQRLEQVQPAPEMRAKLLEAELAVEPCRIDDRHLQRVRVQAWRLGVQQISVHPVESLHIQPRFIASGPGRRPIESSRPYPSTGFATLVNLLERNDFDRLDDEIL
jgi:hypothetical protein